MPEGARRQEGCRGTYISGSLKIARLGVHCDADLHAVQQQSLLTSNGQNWIGADGDLHMQQPFRVLGLEAVKITQSTTVMPCCMPPLGATLKVMNLEAAACRVMSHISVDVKGRPCASI